MNPILFPLWAGGLLWLFLGSEGRPYRLLGWAYVVLLATFMILGGKNYYVAPIYPMLFAAGALGFERVTVGSFAWSRTAYVAAIGVVGVLLRPISCPILSPEHYIAYKTALHIQPPVAERQNNGPLPQFFADEFGWEEMVQRVARVYNGLSPEERTRAAIFCNSWGEAAAVGQIWVQLGCNKTCRSLLWTPKLAIGAVDFTQLPLKHPLSRQRSRVRVSSSPPFPSAVYNELLKRRGTQESTH